MGKIVVLGSANMDIVYRVPHIPAVGETILSTGFARNPGGKGANQAVAAALLGADVTMIGRVGRDGDGQALLSSLKTAGVQLDGVEEDDVSPTGTAFICVSDKGENNIVVYPGANAGVDDDQMKRHEDLLRGAQICVMQLETPHATVWKTLEICKSLGVYTILNPSPVAVVPDDALKLVDCLVPNEKEAAELMGNGAVTAENLQAYMREKGLGTMIVTLGEEGALYVKADSCTHFPCKKLDAVDTTGAGDSFLGALCARLSQGKTMEDAIVFAQAAAAVTVMHMGAQQAMPRLHEVIL